MRSEDAAPRVVIVTGASSGIGRATVRLLAQRGHLVVLASRSEEALLRTQQENSNGTTLVVPTDVADGEAVDELFRAAVARFGRVDAVVHSAAVLAYGRFEDVPREVFDASISTTLLGTANVARAALTQFSHQSAGSLVVVGSLLGKIATPYMSSYVTAKWGVHGLVRCLQIEARSSPGIRISLVSPGGVDTPVYEQAGSYAGRHGRPPPPVDSPEHVARAVVRRLDHPTRESSVGLANPLTVTGFRLLPGVFDALVTPLMHLGGLSRPVENTAGNVLEPRPAGESVAGGWHGRLTRPVLSAAAAVGIATTVLVSVRRWGGRTP